MLGLAKGFLFKTTPFRQTEQVATEGVQFSKFRLSVGRNQALTKFPPRTFTELPNPTAPAAFRPHIS